MNNMNTSPLSSQFLTMPQIPSSSVNKMKQQQWNNNGMGLPMPFDTSLLSMAAASMMTEKPIFMQQEPRADAQAITSQVLAELAEDNLFDTPPTDDIFDLEPVPLPEGKTAQQQGTPNRLALLEDTLNQVLNDEADFFAMHENSNSSSLAAAPAIGAPILPMGNANNNNLLKRALNQESVSSLAAAAAAAAAGEGSPFKRQRTIAPMPSPAAAAAAPSLGEDADEKGERFRDYQSKQWSEKFQELLEFKKERGHCCVPHTFKENPPLARWVKRQRYQYKLKNENKPSTMTDERILALEQMGFVWDSHGAAWEERLSELRDYRQAMGHCNVPSNFSSNPQLATWVKCQRRQYKLFWDGKPSNMTLDRINKLESLGFEWELRGPKKSKANNNSAVAPSTPTPTTSWAL